MYARSRPSAFTWWTEAPTFAAGFPHPGDDEAVEDDPDVDEDADVDVPSAGAG